MNEKKLTIEQTETRIRETVTHTVTRTVRFSFPVGELVTPRCPNCGSCGQLRLVLDAVFPISPGRGVSMLAVAMDGPQASSGATCNACEWSGTYRDLVTR